MSEFKWYVIHVLSGYEAKVVSAIEQKLSDESLSDSVEEFFVPSERVTRMSKGKKIKVEKKFYPGYIFIHASLNELVWNIIKSVPKVSDLLRGSGKPLIVPNREIDIIKNQLEKGTSISDLEVRFSVAESIKIIDGAFKSFIGVVERVDAQKQRLKVSVSIFGRHTPVELDYDQVQKL